MLSNLHVKNLALIDEAEVEFGGGLNILTGETGAGKSILLGSVNLALGKKMSREMIRKGADSALVELVFVTENPRVLELLEEMGLPSEDGQVIITRKISGNRSVSRINGETCTAAAVRRIASLLLDIHGQHDHQSLLYPEKQLEILDAFGGGPVEDARRDVNRDYAAWSVIKKELQSYDLDGESRKREMSFLEFEIDEIESAALKEGEDEALETQYRRMGNAKKITEALQSVHVLSGYDGETGAGEQVGRALRELQAVAALDEPIAGLMSMLYDVDGLLNDFNRELSGYLSELTFSGESFYQTEKRLDEINHLKSKYGKTVADVLSYQAAQQEKLEKLQNFEEQKRLLEKKLQEAEKKLEKSSHKLSDIRKEYAERLKIKIMEGLQDLNFLHVAFETKFGRTRHYTENGYDTMEFLISTNPGEPIKPLAQVVSGGELSRIMLAIKTILADRDDTETLIFDEIDTGISGRTAQKVSEKMARISMRHQVISITHLPQIAAMADTHFEIVKNVAHNETATSIRRLSEEDAVTELARILGGAQITESVLANAREMKELARVQKSARLK